VRICARRKEPIGNDNCRTTENKLIIFVFMKIVAFQNIAFVFNNIVAFSISYGDHRG